MEQEVSNAIVSFTNNAIVANDTCGKKKMKKINDHQGNPPPPPPPKPTKKRRALHFFRAALYMLRRKSKKSMHVDLASKVLVSMRPLNLQTSDNNNNNNQTHLEPASKEIEAPQAPLLLIEKSTIKEEVFTPPAGSPKASKSIVSSSSTDSLTQYASALNLRDLDTCAEEEEEEGCDDNGGDEMIDAKAEEFINQFYEQMRIQNFEYMNRHKARKLKRTSAD